MDKNSLNKELEPKDKIELTDGGYIMYGTYSTNPVRIEIFSNENECLAKASLSTAQFYRIFGNKNLTISNLFSDLRELGVILLSEK